MEILGIEKKLGFNWKDLNWLDFELMKICI